MESISISFSSEDDELEVLSERFESYSLSADVSESESSSSSTSFSCRKNDGHDGHASTTMTSSPLSGPDYADIFYGKTALPVILPAFGGGRNVLIPATTDKPEAELSG